MRSWNGIFTRPLCKGSFIFLSTSLSKGLAVIHFDSEQDAEDQQYNIKTALKRARIKETPDYFKSYTLLHPDLTFEEYKQATSELCEQNVRQFGGILLIVIDGGAQYIKSVNDEDAAVDIVRYFRKDLSTRYNCPVIVIVHLNPDSDKERGHFGSEIQRDC